jgi:hypothetical protein
MLACCVFGQAKQDTINYLQQQANVYLTEMYINKDFGNASKMWDKRVLLEMEDFYQKRKQGHFTDTILANRIKSDVTKYFKRLDEFKIEKTLGSSLETDSNFTVGQIFFEYTETLKGKSEKIKTMLVFISEDKGKTWVIQDWKIKDIADKVDRKIF